MPYYEENRRRMVERYKRLGYVQTERMAQAMLKVPREKFMDSKYVEHAYRDQPFPIPGDGLQTISAPYMYPVSYEPLKINKGDKFLEVGAGSGYGAALAYELTGPNGLVVAIEINPKTYNFAKANLNSTGYNDVRLIMGDGSLGYPDKAPFDEICITAACPKIPSPLIEQLRAPGKLIAPVGMSSILGQDLMFIEKDKMGNISRKSLMKVAYVPLTGKFSRRRF